MTFPTSESTKGARLPAGPRRREPPVKMTSIIEAVRRADGSAPVQQLSPADLQVALARPGAGVPYQYFGFN